MTRAVSKNGVTLTAWWKRSVLADRGGQAYTIFSSGKEGVELNREQLEALAELVNEELARDSIGVKY